MSFKKTKIAIAGVGTVGSGVLDLFNKNSVHKKFGIELTVFASRRKLIIRNYVLRILVNLMMLQSY